MNGESVSPLYMLKMGKENNLIICLKMSSGSNTKMRSEALRRSRMKNETNSFENKQ